MMKHIKIEAKRVTEKLFTQVKYQKYSPENLESAYYEVYSYWRIFNNDVDIRLVLDDQVLFDNGEIINYDSKHPLVLINTLVDPETVR
jgi:hypothetical protein